MAFVHGLRFIAGRAGIDMELIGWVHCAVPQASAACHRAKERKPNESRPDRPCGSGGRFEDVESLEAFMARPRRALVEDLAAVPGDILVLGAGGKMGPTLARLACNAGKRVVAVARFSEQGLRRALERDGIETIACDLL